MSLTTIVSAAVGRYCHCVINARLGVQGPVEIQPFILRRSFHCLGRSSVGIET
jgi:hypothetical protein